MAMAYYGATTPAGTATKPKDEVSRTARRRGSRPKVEACACEKGTQGNPSVKCSACQNNTRRATKRY